MAASVADGRARPRTTAAVSAIGVVLVVEILGVRATDSFKVTFFVVPVLLATIIGLVLLAEHRPRMARAAFLTAGVGSVVAGIVTIFSVGVMFLEVGALLLWTADPTG